MQNIVTVRFVRLVSSSRWGINQEKNVRFVVSFPLRRASPRLSHPVFGHIPILIDSSLPVRSFFVYVLGRYQNQMNPPASPRLEFDFEGGDGPEPLPLLLRRSCSLSLLSRSRYEVESSLADFCC